MWRLGVIGYHIMTTHQVAHALDRSLSASTTAWAFGIGPFVGGYLFDLTCDYRASFAVSALAIAGATVAAWIAAPRNAATLRNARRSRPGD